MDEVIQRLWDLADNSSDDSYKQGVIDALKIVLEERLHECEKKIDKLEYKLWINNFANAVGHPETPTACCTDTRF